MNHNPTPALLPLHQRGEALTISSLDFATGLAIQHKHLLETIRNHQPVIEANFSLVPFETAPVKTDGGWGVKHQTVAYLTEDQALFIGTLSRNSQRVVEFKAVLVRSFAQARRQLSSQPLVQDMLLGQSQRIADLESKLNQVLNSQQQVAQALLALPRSSESFPDETTRAKIQRIVNVYCQAKGLGHREVWRQVYDRLYYGYHVRIRSYKKRSQTESWLEVAERTGHIEKLFAIVSEDLIIQS